MKKLLNILCFIVLASCTSLEKKTIKEVEQVKTAQKQVTVVEKKLSQSTKVYIDGALQALKKQPAEHITTQTKLAVRLLENAQEIEGVPLHSLRLDVEMLSKNIPDNPETKKLLDLESNHREAIKERLKLEEQIKTLRNQIEEDALKLALIHNKSWFEKTKDWIFDWIGLIAILVLLIILGPKIISFISKRII